MKPVLLSDIVPDGIQLWYPCDEQILRYVLQQRAAGRTLSSIGADFGLSGEAIRQKILKAHRMGIQP